MFYQPNSFTEHKKKLFLSDDEIRAVWDKVKDIRKILSLNSHDIASLTGISQEKIDFLKSAVDTVRKFSNLSKSRIKIRSPRSVYNAFKFLKYEEKEELWIGLVDHGGKLILKIKIKKGNESGINIFPYEIFHEIFKHQGTRFILVHNHPAGSVKPSPEDIEFTNKISKTASELKVEFIDHLIVGGNRYFSFKENLLI